MKSLFKFTILSLCSVAAFAASFSKFSVSNKDTQFVNGLKSNKSSNGLLSNSNDSTQTVEIQNITASSTKTDYVLVFESVSTISDFKSFFSGAASGYTLKNFKIINSDIYGEFTSQSDSGKISFSDTIGHRSETIPIGKYVKTFQLQAEVYFDSACTQYLGIETTSTIFKIDQTISANTFTNLLTNSESASTNVLINNTWYEAPVYYDETSGLSTDVTTMSFATSANAFKAMQETYKSKAEANCTEKSVLKSEGYFDVKYNGGSETVKAYPSSHEIGTLEIGQTYKVYAVKINGQLYAFHDLQYLDEELADHKDLIITTYLGDGKKPQTVYPSEEIEFYKKTTIHNNKSFTVSNYSETKEKESLSFDYTHKVIVEKDGVVLDTLNIGDESKTYTENGKYTITETLNAATATEGETYYQWYTYIGSGIDFKVQNDSEEEKYYTNLAYHLNYDISCGLTSSYFILDESKEKKPIINFTSIGDNQIRLIYTSLPDEEGKTTTTTSYINQSGTGEDATGVEISKAGTYEIKDVNKDYETWEHTIYVATNPLSLDLSGNNKNGLFITPTFPYKTSKYFASIARIKEDKTAQEDHITDIDWDKYLEDHPEAQIEYYDGTSWVETKPSNNIEITATLNFKNAFGVYKIDAYDLYGKTISKSFRYQYVIPKPTNVVINLDQLEYELGKTQSVSATIYTDEGKSEEFTDVIFSSNDENIVKVNNNNQIEATGVGEATLTARVVGYTEIMATKSITVNAPKPKSIKLSNESGEITSGTNFNLTLDETINLNASIEWSTDPSALSEDVRARAIAQGYFNEGTFNFATDDKNIASCNVSGNSCVVSATGITVKGAGELQPKAINYLKRNAEITVSSNTYNLDSKCIQINNSYKSTIIKDNVNIKYSIDDGEWKEDSDLNNKQFKRNQKIKFNVTIKEENPDICHYFNVISSDEDVIEVVSNINGSFEIETKSFGIATIEIVSLDNPSCLFIYNLKVCPITTNTNGESNFYIGDYNGEEEAKANYSVGAIQLGSIETIKGNADVTAEGYEEYIQIEQTIEENSSKIAYTTLTPLKTKDTPIVITIKEHNANGEEDEWKFDISLYNNELERPMFTAVEGETLSEISGSYKDGFELTATEGFNAAFSNNYTSITVYKKGQSDPYAVNPETLSISEIGDYTIELNKTICDSTVGSVSVKNTYLVHVVQSQKSKSRMNLIYGLSIGGGALLAAGVITTVIIVRVRKKQSLRK